MDGQGTIEVIGSTDCQCCGVGRVFEPGCYEICGVCGWEDDSSQAAHPDMAGGANELSLGQARKAWDEGKPGPHWTDWDGGFLRHVRGGES